MNCPKFKKPNRIAREERERKCPKKKKKICEMGEEETIIDLIEQIENKKSEEFEWNSDLEE